MMYGIAIKYGAIAIIIISILSGVYFKGYNNAHDKYQSLMLAQEAANARILQAYTDRALEKQKEAARLAEKINSEALDHEKQVQVLESRINDKLNANTSGLRKGLCKRADHSNLPKADSPSSPVKEANDYGLSEEFRQFLVSSFRRAEEAGHYSEIAHEWIFENCKLGNFDCGK
jgi:hypothetical protein